MTQHVGDAFDVGVDDGVELLRRDLPNLVVLVDGPGIVDYDVGNARFVHDRARELLDAAV